jgi:hypothetical protein
MGPGDKVSLAYAFKYFVFLSARAGSRTGVLEGVLRFRGTGSVSRIPQSFIFPCRQHYTSLRLRTITDQPLHALRL